MGKDFRDYASQDSLSKDSNSTYQMVSYYYHAHPDPLIFLYFLLLFLFIFQEWRTWKCLVSNQTEKTEVVFSEINEA